MNIQQARKNLEKFYKHENLEDELYKVETKKKNAIWIEEIGGFL